MCLPRFVSSMSVCFLVVSHGFTVPVFAVPTCGKSIHFARHVTVGHLIVYVHSDQKYIIDMSWSEHCFFAVVFPRDGTWIRKLMINHCFFEVPGLVNIQKTMENHHFDMGKSTISTGPFSIANC